MPNDVKIVCFPLLLLELKVESRCRYDVYIVTAVEERRTKDWPRELRINRKNDLTMYISGIGVGLNRFSDISPKQRTIKSI